MTDQAAILRDPALRVLWMARVDYEAHSQVEAHAHDYFYQTLFVLEGTGHAVIDGQEHTVQPNSYYTFPRQISHKFQFRSSAVTIDVKYAVNDESLRELIDASPLSGACSFVELEEMKQWFRLSLDNDRKPRPLIPYRVDAGFKSTLLSFVQRSSEPAAGEASGAERTKAALESDFPAAVYIRQHLGDNLSLQSIADQFGFHPHYLIKLFRDSVGMTPNRYLQEVRLVKAKEYLEFTSLSIAEISERIGWTVPYFSRLFHKTAGVSATEYRKTILTAVGKDIVLERNFENEWRISPIPQGG